MSSVSRRAAAALLPDPNANGLKLQVSEPASAGLLKDLRSDKGMGWIPQHAWLSKVRIDGNASDLRFDLAIDASGRGQPSLRDAGLAPFGPMQPPAPWVGWVLLLAAVGVGLPVFGGAYRARLATRRMPPAGA